MTARPTVALLLSKDPVLERGGDVELSRLLTTLAADTYRGHRDLPVGAVGDRRDRPRAGRPHAAPGPQAEIAPARLAGRSLAGRRSLVHVRFDSPELRSAIESVPAEVYLAEHSYMAESFLASRRAGTDRLAVNTHVSESLVWRATRGVLGRVEGPGWCGTSCASPARRRRRRDVRRRRGPRLPRPRCRHRTMAGSDTAAGGPGGRGVDTASAGVPRDP